MPMPPAVIVEWCGPCDHAGLPALEGQYAFGTYLLCMAFPDDVRPCRYVTGWRRGGNGNNPVQGRHDLAGHRFYVGELVSYSLETSHKAAEWALIHSLFPELNLQEDEAGPITLEKLLSDEKVCCMSLVSWFRDQNGVLMNPPPGFPVLLTYHQDHYGVLRS